MHLISCSREKRIEFYGIDQDLLPKVHCFQWPGFPFRVIVVFSLHLHRTDRNRVDPGGRIHCNPGAAAALSSATVRRLHDTDRTGWWLLLPVGITVLGVILGAVMSFVGGPFLGVGIAVVGSIAGFLTLLVFLIQPGDPHTNQYGPNPLQQASGQPGFPGAVHSYGSPAPESDYGPANFDSKPTVPSQPTVGEQQRYCTQCGMQLQPDARFCTVCGTAA